MEETTVNTRHKRSIIAIEVVKNKMKTKHSQIYEAISNDIDQGKYSNGDRLPSEVQLAIQFSVSRPTVGRALEELAQKGYIQRRMGSGTYVSSRDKNKEVITLGLLLPGYEESEIFEPICKQITYLAEKKNLRLTWSGSTSDNAEMRRRQVEKQCEEYIKQNVNGVFFSPLERTSGKDIINKKICESFDKANIPIVLIDRDIADSFERSHHDLVGIDNFSAAYKVTNHLLQNNCKEILFVARPYSAPTVDQRIAGYQAAMAHANIPPHQEWILIGDPSKPDFLQKIINKEKPLGIFCANDATAAVLMHCLDEMNVAIPKEVRVVGFDDMKYAKHLRVSLTTFRQPCDDIGTIALKLLLDRIEDPEEPIKTIFLEGKLIVRKSCGSHLL